jgi:hypothetical protein
MCCSVLLTSEKKQKNVETYFINAAASLPPVAHGFESTSDK